MVGVICPLMGVSYNLSVKNWGEVLSLLPPVPRALGSIEQESMVGGAAATKSPEMNQDGYNCKLNEM